MLQLIYQLPPVWRSAVHGALLGDAFGVPHEFKAARDIPCKESLAMVMPADYPKTYPWVPYGTWSDDGSQLLALLDALVAHNGRYDASQFGESMLAWFFRSRYQAGGKVFDCGLQTSAALRLLADGKRPAPVDENQCGNGSLMRVLPVAALPIAFGLDQVESLRIAMAQSDLTHPQPRTRVCCALYVAIAWMALDGRTNLRSLLPEAGQLLAISGLLTPKELSALDVVLGYGNSNVLKNSGYVVDTLWSALAAVDNATSLSDALCNAVAGGGDADTVACLAGGLAALVFGWDETAHAWRRAMTYPA